MKNYKFIWDEKKAVLNYKKYSVSFEETRTVFYDENAIEFFDDKHSESEEDRFLLLGFSFKGRILMICHCVREGGNLIRLINARKATKNEQKYYLR